VSQTAKYAKNIERFRQAVQAHDRENPDHDPAIGLSYHDLERLGMDVGEELWPGVCVYDDGGQASNFRVLCNGEHVDERLTAETEITHAVGAEA
jgi:hypothetical protein